MNFYPLLIDALKIPILLILLISIGKYFYGEFTSKLNHSIVRNNIELIFGSIILFSVFAIFKTSGKTVLSLALIILISQYFFFKIRPKFSNLTFNKSDIINLASISIIFFLLFALQLFKYDYFNEKVTHFGYCDYSSYSDLAERMLLNGNETYLDWHSAFNKYNFSYEKLPLPYHFYELWIDSFLLSISNTKGIYVFLYLLIPFLGTLVFTSLFALSSIFFNKISKKKWILLFLTAFLFVFFIGKIPFKSGGFWSYTLSHPRLFSFYIIFPLFIILQK